MNTKTRRRTERVEVRMTREQEDLFGRAAALERRSMTNFIIASAQEAAMDIISRHNVLQLSPRDQQIFIDGLLNPPAPNEALRAAAARYNAI
jgi:uncharacterized protein (DUF1778 family)